MWYVLSRLQRLSLARLGSFALLAMLTVLPACSDDTGPTSPTTPDNDLDDDGIANIIDACPTEPETQNGVFDSDGCPDTELQFYQAVRADAEQFWSAAFATAGFTYFPISPFQSYVGSVLTACGLLTGPAWYCSGGVYFDLEWFRAMLDEIGDGAPAVTLAHEIGHHVSVLLGWLKAVNVSEKQWELQADCWAGAWVQWVQTRGLLEQGDIEEATGLLFSFGDQSIPWFSPVGHGTPLQRVTAFGFGLQQGPPACTSSQFFATFPNEAPREVPHLAKPAPGLPGVLTARRDP